MLLLTGCSSSGSGTGATTGFRLEVDVHSSPGQIHAKDVYLAEPNGRVDKIGRVLRIDAIQSTGSAIHVALDDVPKISRTGVVSVCSNRIELHSGKIGPYIVNGDIVPASRSELIVGRC